MSKLINKEIPCISRACGGLITLSNIRNAALTGVGFVLVTILIAIGLIVIACLRLGTA